MNGDARVLWLCWLLVVLAAMSACAAPPQLAACLDDERIMDQYNSVQRTRLVGPLYAKSAQLVGGIDPARSEINCFWGEVTLGRVLGDDFAFGAREPVVPINRCIALRNEDCTVLMVNDNVLFRPRATVAPGAPMPSRPMPVPQGTPVAAAGGGWDVVWHLLGAVAMGAAQAYVEQAARPPTRLADAPAATVPARPVRPALRCTPQPITLNGAPEYRCR